VRRGDTGLRGAAGTAAAEVSASPGGGGLPPLAISRRNSSGNQLGAPRAGLRPMPLLRTGGESASKPGRWLCLHILGQVVG
jgi:hypothetical protein